MTSVIYVSDIQFADFDPADLFDLAYLLQKNDYDLRGVCLRDDGKHGKHGERIVNALCAASSKPAPAIAHGADGFLSLLEAAPEPVNVVVTGGYDVVSCALRENQPLLRQKMARLFLVGGYVNKYDSAGDKKTDIIRVPLDPRLRERFPKRFAPNGDPRILHDTNASAWAHLLTCGEGVIWLPRDVCVFRYAAPHLLQGGGALCDFLCRELFWANLPPFPDRYEAAAAPVFLSALPALLLATQPDPLFWMRWFRAILARVDVDDTYQIRAFETRTDAPNLYAVTALDGQALAKRLTDVLNPANPTGN